MGRFLGLLVVVLLFQVAVSGCRSEQRGESDEPLRFELGESTSAFRDIGKRSASELEG